MVSNQGRRSGTAGTASKRTLGAQQRAPPTARSARPCPPPPPLQEEEHRLVKLIANTAFMLRPATPHSALFAPGYSAGADPEPPLLFLPTGRPLR